MPEVGSIRQGISRYQPLPTTNVAITNHFVNYTVKVERLLRIPLRDRRAVREIGHFCRFCPIWRWAVPEIGHFSCFCPIWRRAVREIGHFCRFCPIGRRESACAKMGVRQMTKRKRNKLIQRQLVCAQNGQGVSGNRTRLLFCHARGIDC